MIKWYENLPSDLQFLIVFALIPFVMIVSIGTASILLRSVWLMLGL